ncbi:MAG: ubiquinone/menaquinone biosynthesis methyltransferase, partial [Proteobacteria bacterium]|nr:ubiquinone/menaquinone biosynthesis methyltransferase [Pseudomonadota bacterium]
MRIDLAPNERIALVKGMFARIAKRYDTLNHVFSLGRDVFWRRAAARRVRTFRTGRLLDLAAGTGDLTLTLSRMHPEARVIGLDFTWAMLNQARIKSALRAGTQGVRLVGGDALALPFPDRSLDAVTMGFGIRNIPDQPAAFREMLRVLVPNGRAVILELTPPLPSLIGRLYDTYLGRLIPGLGGLISG